MENKTKQTRRTADQILFAEHEKFEQKKRALRALEKLLKRLDAVCDDVRASRDKLEALGMNRAEIIEAFEVDAVTAKVLKSSSEKSERPASPATLATPPEPALPASDDDENETANDKPAQNW